MKFIVLSLSSSSFKFQQGISLAFQTMAFQIRECIPEFRKGRQYPSIYPTLVFRSLFPLHFRMILFQCKHATTYKFSEEGIFPAVTLVTHGFLHNIYGRCKLQKLMQHILILVLVLRSQKAVPTSLNRNLEIMIDHD